MRYLFAGLIVLIPIQGVAAGTFTGATTGTFRVSETLDGTTSTATKTGTLFVSLTTDYSTMRWSMNWDVNLLMAGGPTQSFETNLTASGTVTSRRCNTSLCSLAGAGDPSPLSFPDATGKAGGGSYILFGDAAWSLTDRIVSTSRTRTSPTKLIVASGGASYYGSPHNSDQAFSPGNHYLTVANYPASITLTPGYQFYSASEDQPNQWTIDSIRPFTLGTWSNGTNNSVTVTISSLNNTVQLVETPAGDFTSNSVVDASDYVLWRKSPGPLSPFLSNYDVWRGNFGASASALGISQVPEPSVFVYCCLAVSILCGRPRLVRT